MLKNYDEISELYAKHSISGTSYLSFKNIPQLIKTHTKGTKTLDFGCGSGRSTRFLASLGMEVIGVDINATILQEAQKNTDSKSLKYQLITDTLPYPDHSFDCVFSAMVLVTISSIEQLIAIFKEIRRVLKPNGVFIAVTASALQYTNMWLSINTDFPQNKQLKSGDLAKIILTNIGLELLDYYWTEPDYEQVIHKSGFSILQIDHPLGEKSDGYSWVSETKISPYVTYVLTPRTLR